MHLEVDGKTRSKGGTWLLREGAGGVYSWRGGEKIVVNDWMREEWDRVSEGGYWRSKRRFDCGEGRLVEEEANRKMVVGWLTGGDGEGK